MTSPSSKCEEGINLRLVFDLCEPVNARISVEKLRGLFRQHLTSEQAVCLNFDCKEVEGAGDSWISYDEFRQGIADYLNGDCDGDGGPDDGRSNGVDDDGDSGHCSGEDTSKLEANEGNVNDCHQKAAPILTAVPEPIASDLKCCSSSLTSLSTSDFLLLDPLLSSRSGSESTVVAMESVSPSHPAAAAQKPVHGTHSDEDEGMASPRHTMSPSSGQSAGGSRSQCSSLSDRGDLMAVATEEENFDGYGANEDVEYDSELLDLDEMDSSVASNNNNLEDTPSKMDSSSNSGTGPASLGRQQQQQQPNFQRRHSWMRTSLRRSPAGGAAGAANGQESLVPPRRWGSFRYSPGKRVGSHAIASHLYHNGNASFNSSGRSSNCGGDDGLDGGFNEAANSDVSLEDDVNDLNQKVHSLTEKVGALTESQAQSDEKYSRVKRENDLLRTKINDLEEEVRELQLSQQEQEEAEAKRAREMIARLDREKQLEVENYAIRLQGLEKENHGLRLEGDRLRVENDRLRSDKSSVEETLTEAQQSLQLLREENEALADRVRRAEADAHDQREEGRAVVEELNRELDGYRQQSAQQRRTSPLLTVHSIEDDDVVDGAGGRISELEAELRQLREESKKLANENTELKGQVLQYGVDQGKMLMSTAQGETSIGREITEMTAEEEHEFTRAELKEIQSSLRDQKEVNMQLRHYIDNILMNIMEKYPELLEVRK